MITLTRYSGNPVLTANPNHPWEAQNVSNAGAVIHDGKVHLLYRAEGFEPRHPVYQAWPRASLGLAVSADGLHFDRFDQPAMVSLPSEFAAEAIEDPRITKIGDTYYIVYVTTSGFCGDHLFLATTRDFKTYKRCGSLMPHINQRTSALFPQKIDGQYAMLHRIMPSLWISFSDDLKTWSDPHCLLSPQADTWYNLKLGPGAQPIEMDDAWLVFWHAKAYDKYVPHGMYRLGVLWLDKNDPTHILKVQQEPVLEVEREEDRNGYCKNVVYTCGAVKKDGQYLVYYGCADRCLSVATVSVEAVERELRG